MSEKNKKIRIAQIAPNNTPISADQNKAIYSHIAHLVDGFVDKKNEVVLYGHPESNTRGTLRSIDFKKNGNENTSVSRYEQWASLSDCYDCAANGEFDVIHSHMNVMTGFFSRLEKNVPTFISVHSPIEEWMKPILLKFKEEKYISFSLAQRKQLPELNWYANIYHGIDTDLFAFNEKPDDYFLFLGRITKDKGPHIAIEACKSADVPLRIAGRSYSTEGYWHEQIEPHINGNTVRFFGEVALAEKIPLIQNAKALIFPTTYNEAFGYVLIEAMSCGTPVIAFPNGSVPEIVKDGVTGFLVNDEKEMAEAIKKIDTIDRAVVRKRAEQFFSLPRMLSHYDSVYRRAIQENNFKNKEKLAKKVFPRKMEL